MTDKFRNVDLSLFKQCKLCGLFQDKNLKKCFNCDEVFEDDNTTN